MGLLWLLLGLGLLLALWSKRQLLLLGTSLPGPWALPLLGNAQMIGKLKPECKCWGGVEGKQRSPHVCGCRHIFGLYRAT